MNPLLICYAGIGIPYIAYLFIISVYDPYELSRTSEFFVQPLYWIGGVFFGHFSASFLGDFGRSARTPSANFLNFNPSIFFLGIGLAGFCFTYLTVGVPLLSDRYETRLEVVTSPAWPISQLGVIGLFLVGANRRRTSRASFYLTLVYLIAVVFSAWKNYVLMAVWFLIAPIIFSRKFKKIVLVLYALAGVMILVLMNVVRPNSNSLSEIFDLLLYYLGSGYINAANLEKNPVTIDAFSGLTALVGSAAPEPEVVFERGSWNTLSAAYEIFSAYGIAGSILFGVLSGFLLQVLFRRRGSSVTLLFLLIWLVYFFILFHNGSIFRSTTYFVLILVALVVLPFTRFRLVR